jgi:hypothetical protein
LFTVHLLHQYIYLPSSFGLFSSPSILIRIFCMFIRQILFTYYVNTCILDHHSYIPFINYANTYILHLHSAYFGSSATLTCLLSMFTLHILSDQYVDNIFSIVCQSSQSMVSPIATHLQYALKIRQIPGRKLSTRLIQWMN